MTAQLARQPSFRFPYSSGYGPTEVENHRLADERWEAIDIDPGIVAVPLGWAEEHNLAESQPFPWDPDKRLYVISAFHTIHCLVSKPSAIALHWQWLTIIPRKSSIASYTMPTTGDRSSAKSSTLCTALTTCARMPCATRTTSSCLHRQTGKAIRVLGDSPGFARTGTLLLAGLESITLATSTSPMMKWALLGIIMRLKGIWTARRVVRMPPGCRGTWTLREMTCSC